MITSMLVAGLLALSTDSASAQTKTFRPVLQAPQAFIFKPHGVTPQTVRRASVKLHRRGRVVERRVNVRRVRQALRNGLRIRIRKPRSAHAARLIIHAHPWGPCGSGTFSSLTPPSTCWRPYSDASPFNRTVPASPPLVADSSSVVSRLAAFGPPQKLTGGDADTGGDWNHPIYFSQPSDPTYTVHCTQQWGTCEVEDMQVRIPAQARPAGGGDAHLGVIDQQSGWEYDFWQVQQKPSGGGTLLVSWGGRTRIDGDGLGSNATAAHFGLAAGVIRPSELAAGSINHALFMVVKCSNGTAVWPAESGTGTSCSSIGLPNTNAPAMGQHFYLDMTDAEINALIEPAWEKTILRAIAHYGMFVGDTGGSSWNIQFESGSSYTSFGNQDPWTRLGQQYGVTTWDGAADGKRRYVFDLQNVVNWGAELKVADPCVAQAACG